MRLSPTISPERNSSVVELKLAIDQVNCRPQLSKKIFELILFNKLLRRHRDGKASIFVSLFTNRECLCGKLWLDKLEQMGDMSNTAKDMSSKTGQYIENCILRRLQ